MSEATEKIASAVKSEFALGMQRIFIIGGLPILLGVGGFLGVRAVTTIDDLGRRLELFSSELRHGVDEQSSAIRVLQTTMQLRATARDEQVKQVQNQIGDHETRIRGLERAGGLTGPR